VRPLEVAEVLVVERRRERVWRSLKVWIGPCSLSKNGRPSRISVSASSTSAPATTAGATVSRGRSMVSSA
jgi:hypothetical protein